MNPPPSRPARSRRRWLRRLAWIGAFLLIAFYLLWIYPFWGFPFNAQRHGRVPLTPPWALECWVWEDDTNTGAAVEELLAGYARHDIPVRTVLIDSPWSTRYNDFRVDETRYPDPAGFFGRLQTNGYRVVLWMTPMVNSRNKDTAERDSSAWLEAARTNGFLAGDGRQIGWWKGRGAFIDYTHPAAREWWHGLQRQVLDWGVDGWKLDGTDTLFSGPGYIPWQRTHAGWMSTRAYMDLYNREEYRHGLSVNPDFIVLTRAIDNRYFPLSHPEGFAPFDAAPVTWVGDRTHEWSSRPSSRDADQDAVRSSASILDRGFEGALRDILASARKGYCVVGDDVAGYHGPEPIPPRLYIRWAQFAAFTGLFLNGGHGERRLWERSPEELSIIRRYAWMHTELVPYLYTLVAECHAGGPPMMRPLAKGRFHYLLGEDLFIAPIHRDQPTVTIEFPPGRWRHLFNDRDVIEGPRSVTRDFDLGDFPVYVRDGAALPLGVSRDYTGFGDRESAGKLTWAIWPAGSREARVQLPDGSGEATLAIKASDGAGIRLELGGTPKAHVLRIQCTDRPGAVQSGRGPLKEGTDWRHDAATGRLWIRSGEATNTWYEIR